MVLLVGRTDLYRSISPYDVIFSGSPAEGMVIIGRSLDEYRIPIGKVEYHTVSPPYVAESFQALVIPLDKRGIGLAPADDVVRKRHGERCFRELGAESKLAYEEMVSGKERTFHRGGRNLEGLEEENIDEGDKYHGKDDGIEPVKPDIMFLTLPVLLFPEHPLHPAGDVMIENDNESEEPPIVSQPDHPRNIEEGPEGHPHPIIAAEILPGHHQKLFYRVDDGLECLWIVHGEVCKDLAVESYVLLCELAHELGVGHTVAACGSIDPLDPERTEFAFLGFTVTVSIGKTLLVGVLCYRPDIFP